LIDKKVRSLLDIFFDNKKCRAKALRYYETFKGHLMPWHSDNKNTLDGYINHKGLIFIYYCEDVFDGEFRYIEGSHLWSGEKEYSDYSDYSDEFIEKTVKKR